MKTEELQEKFSTYDTGNTGYIDLDSFRRILHEYAKEYNIVLQITDAKYDADIKISFQQFQEYMLRSISENPPIHYQPNGTVNWISTLQVNEAQRQSPEDTDENLELSEEKIIEILQQLDSDEDGHVSFAEFLKYHKPDKDAFRTINIKI